MENAQDRFSAVGVAHDVEGARRLLQQHQDMKKGNYSLTNIISELKVKTVSWTEF